MQKVRTTKRFHVCGSLLFFLVIQLLPVYANEIHKSDESIEDYLIQPVDGNVFVRHEGVANLIPKEVQHKRFHIGILGGYFKALSVNDFHVRLKDDTWDLTNAGLGNFNFRYSASRSVDLVFDSLTWGTDYSAGNDKYKVMNRFWGIGIRINGNSTVVNPFVQGLYFLVQEDKDITIEIISERDSVGNLIYGTHEYNVEHTDAGFSINGGIDIKVSELISIPIEVTFLKTSSGYGNPLTRKDDLSGFGLSIGVNLNL